MRARRAMVFGVFDLLHPGHHSLLRQARRHGEEVIAVVARDAAVRRLKGRAPEWSERKRLRELRATGLVAKAVLGDAKQGSYAVVRTYHPDLICLGYDQKALRKDLVAAMADGRVRPTPLRILKAYKPVVFHTSLRRDQKKTNRN